MYNIFLRSFMPYFLKNNRRSDFIRNAACKLISILAFDIAAL